MGDLVEPRCNKRMNMMKLPTSTISVSGTQKFSVTAERVFDAWLDPALIARWMFGPALREEEVLRIDPDAKVNGRFAFLVRHNGEEIDHMGTYLELDRPPTGLHLGHQVRVGE